MTCQIPRYMYVTNLVHLGCLRSSCAQWTPALLQFATAELGQALQDLHYLVMKQFDTDYNINDYTINDGKVNAKWKYTS